MKIKSGFVSNSSTASFIVKVKEDRIFSKNEKQLISDEQIVILKEFGFRPITVHSPQYLDPIEPNFVQEETGRLGYVVTVNEDDVVQFLVDNRIPFEASVHYGQKNYFYNGKGTKVLSVPNFGIVASCYGVDSFRDNIAQTFINELDYMSENILEDSQVESCINIMKLIKENKE